MQKKELFFLITLFVMGFLVGKLTPEPGIDWLTTYLPVSTNIFDPYSVRMFINPPWAGFFVIWAGAIPEISFSIHVGLCFLFFGWMVLKKNGSPFALFLTLTSVPFMRNFVIGNIEWVIALGFIVPRKWGIPILMLKPQVAGLVCFYWIRQANNKLALIIPAALVVLGSFAIWGNWIPDFLGNLSYVKSAGMDEWNLSLLPWSAGVGVLIVGYIALYNMDESTGEFLGSLSSILLTPYFGFSSLAVPFTLLAIRHPISAFFVWVVLWAMVILKQS